MVAPILLTVPENHDQTIHRFPVNGLIVIFQLYSKNLTIRNLSWGAPQES